MLKVKKIFRPRLKKFLNSKFILNKQKLLALKKKKWKKYVNYFSRLNKKKKKIVITSFTTRDRIVFLGF